MNRIQRSAHARIWPILIVALITIAGAALAAKLHADEGVAAAAMRSR